MRTIGIGLVMVLGTLPATATAQTVQPGMWETSITTDSVEMADAPPGMAQAMRGRTVKTKNCITPEQAARGPQDMLKADKSCKFARYTVAGGRLSSEMTCNSHGMKMTATSTGTFTPTSFAMKGRTVMTGDMAMTVSSTITGRRLGPCGK